MSKALYNGYELPALPEWDKEAYPYAYIFSIGTQTDYFHLTLLPADTEFVYNSDIFLLGKASHYLTDETGLGWDKWRWGLESFEIENGYGRSIWAPEGTTDIYITTIWSNFDIYSESGQLLLAASEPAPIKEGFDLKSFLTGFALGLSGKPLPLSTGKKLVGYSYNGTVLPQLPEWDKTVYPYAVMGYSTLSGYDGIVFLYALSGTLGGDEISNIYASHTWYFYNGEWVEGTGIIKIDPFWANYDVMKDGTVYVAASDPVPVYE